MDYGMIHVLERTQSAGDLDGHDTMNLVWRDLVMVGSSVMVSYYFHPNVVDV